MVKYDIPLRKQGPLRHDEAREEQSKFKKNGGTLSG